MAASSSIRIPDIVFNLSQTNRDSIASNSNTTKVRYLLLLRIFMAYNFFIRIDIRDFPKLGLKSTEQVSILYPIVSLICYFLIMTNKQKPD